MIVAKPTVANVTMTTANTEYSYDFPAGTKSFAIKLRAINALLKVYFVSGSSTVFTIPYGETFKVENAKVGGSTVYLKSASATQVAEVTSWR